MLRLKHTVRVRGLQPEMVPALMVATAVFEQYGYDCTVTSITDSEHATNSLHHTGCAMDLRTRHLASPEMARTIASDIQDALGPYYDVVGHSNHLHVEYDPI